MTDDVLLQLLRDLTTKVDALATSVAVLSDRRGDSVAADKAMSAKVDALDARVKAMEDEAIANKAKAKVLAALIAGGATVGGAGLAKLLAMLLGG